MPLSREQKEQIVADMAAKLQGAGGLVFTDYRGLDVDEIGDVRAKLRESASAMHVIKNTLLRRAFLAADMEPPEDLLVGPTAIAVLSEEVSKGAKALLDFEDDIDDLEVRGGIMEGKVMDHAGVEMMSKLPTREEVQQQIVGVIAAPMRDLVSVLSAPGRDLARVIQAHVDEGGEAA